jgi:plastocyanin
MNRNMKQKAFSLPILAFFALTITLSGCKDFSFFTELGLKGELKISPSTVTTTVDTSVTFSTTGGNPPYTYQVISGSGTIDSASGVYTAPSSPSSDIVVATDSSGQSGTATVTVVSTIEALQISPTTASVSVGNSISFVATGGEGPYTFAFEAGGNNSGGGITADGEYTAGSITGVTDTIIVTDSDSPQQTCSIPATVSVSGLQTNVDYSISAHTFPTSAFVDTGVTGNFTIHNEGTATGTANISWWLFISEDGTFGGDGEHLVDSGTVSTGIGPNGDEVVTPSGSWPSHLGPGNYDLFIMVSSPDDLNHDNNVYPDTSSGIPFTLDVPDVDYKVASVTYTDLAPRYGQNFDIHFVLENAGADPSTEPAQWEVWISENATIDAGDVKTASGTEITPYLAGGGDTKTVDLTRPWPYGSENSTDYYIIVRVSSTQDTAAGHDTNNTADSGAVTVYQPQVNYAVTSVSHTVDPSEVVASRPFNASFQLEHTGSDDGSTTAVEYTIYASTDTVISATTDTVVAFGTTGALTAGSSKSVDFKGTWPLTGDNYYLIVDVSHPDDIDESDNVGWTAGTISVRDVQVDYQAEILAGDAFGDKAGNSVSGSFTLTNNGPDDSLEEVEWSVYASTDTSLDVSDWLIQSATDPAAHAASGSASIVFSGTWPPVAGNYYLLVKISSAEDVISATTGNNLAVSLDISGGTATWLPVAAPDVDYSVTSVSYTAGSKDLGGPFTGEFRYVNNGPNDGARLVEWAAYASLDKTLDAGDVRVGSGGGLVPLASGSGSGIVPFSGIWPNDYGEYYLFVEVISQDVESNPLDNNDYDAAGFIAVGYYDETFDNGDPDPDPNGDWTNLLDVDRFGVTLKPGTSVHISGYMDTGDYDDIFEFPLDPLTTNVTVTASWQNSLPPSRQVTLWFFIGVGGDDDGFGGYYITGGDQITIVWEPYTLPGPPYATVWIDLENSNLEDLGITSINITAN